MKRASLLILVAALAFPSLAGEPAVTTVVLVRHAEKVDDSKDPLLSTAGTARAAELARLLGSAGVTTIYVTPWNRTRLTAAPLAAALGIDPVEVPTGAEYAAEVASRILAKHRGETVLVVGHSNTTGNVMRALGVEGVPPIPESQYDDLFLVTLVDGIPPKLLPLRYGAVKR